MRNRPRRSPGAAKGARSSSIALGIDFGTESVRALLVDLNGVERGAAIAKYRHGQITSKLPTTGKPLPPHFALQHPQDWLDSAAKSARAALRMAGANADQVIGVGVDFTSCTMLPALADGTPLCQTEKFAGEKYAWPKLWKHHGAQKQADRINALACERNEPWLARYGGAIGLEWFFPKLLESLENAPAVYAAADVWLEGGDWFVWQLIGGPAVDLPRSTCQAGYKAMWSREAGYPPAAFFKALHPRLEHVVAEKLPGRFLAPGEAAGGLCARMAARLGLREGTPVGAAIIDAHAGVPGCGAEGPGTLVMVMGTSSCHMLNATANRAVPGVAGIVADGILPGLVGYETGQAAVGDSFAWLRRTVGHRDFARLETEAAALPPGADGVLCMDWLNGCRTPLMDAGLTAAFTGLTLAHGPAHLYRALMEASAFGVRWIVDLLRGNGVPADRFIATGGLPHHNPLLVQIYADVLDEPIAVHPSKHGPALGAAILGAVAARRDSSADSIAALIRRMASPPAVRKATRLTKPRRAATRAYEVLYRRYRALAAALQSLDDPRAN